MATAQNPDADWLVSNPLRARQESAKHHADQVSARPAHNDQGENNPPAFDKLRHGLRIAFARHQIDQDGMEQQAPVHVAPPAACTMGTSLTRATKLIRDGNPVTSAADVRPALFLTLDDLTQAGRNVADIGQHVALFQLLPTHRHFAGMDAGTALQRIADAGRQR